MPSGDVTATTNFKYQTIETDKQITTVQETTMDSKQGDYKEGYISEVNSCLTYTAPKYNSYACFHYIYTVNQNMDIIYEITNGVVPWEQPSEESEQVEGQQTYRLLQADKSPANGAVVECKISVTVAVDSDGKYTFTPKDPVGDSCASVVFDADKDLTITASSWTARQSWNQPADSSDSF